MASTQSNIIAFISNFLRNIYNIRPIQRARVEPGLSHWRRSSTFNLIVAWIAGSGS